MYNYNTVKCHHGDAYASQRKEVSRGQAALSLELTYGPNPRYGSHTHTQPNRSKRFTVVCIFIVCMLMSVRCVLCTTVFVVMAYFDLLCCQVSPSTLEQRRHTADPEDLHEAKKTSGRQRTASVPVGVLIYWPPMRRRPFLAKRFVA